MPYSPFSKDEFNISAKELTEEELRSFISSYYYAKDSLNNEEQIFIEEHYINFRYGKEIADIRFSFILFPKYADVFPFHINRLTFIKYKLVILASFLCSCV